MASTGLFRTARKHHFSALDSYLPSDCAVVITFPEPSKAVVRLGVGVDPQTLTQIDRYPGDIIDLTIRDSKLLRDDLDRNGLPAHTVPGLSEKIERDDKIERYADSKGKSRAPESERGTTSRGCLPGCGTALGVFALFGLVVTEAFDDESTASEVAAVIAFILSIIAGAWVAFKFARSADARSDAFGKYQNLLEEHSEYFLKDYSRVRDLAHSVSVADTSLVLLEELGLDTKEHRNELEDLIAQTVRGWQAEEFYSRRHDKYRSMLSGLTANEIDSDEDLTFARNKRDKAARLAEESYIQAEEELGRFESQLRGLQREIRIAQAKLEATGDRHTDHN